jgi:predicted permease
VISGFWRLFRIGRWIDDVHRDVEDEVRFYLERTEEALQAEGMSEEDARREARRRFGDVSRYQREMERIDRGRKKVDARTEGWMMLPRSVAFAVRGIRRSPGFALAVIVTLGLGIGANVTMFRVVDRLLLSPPEHVESPDQVRRVYVSRISFDDRLYTSAWHTYPDYEDLAHVRAFEATAAYTRPLPRTLGSGEGALRVRAARATASLFPLLGVEPALGRFFTAEEDVVGAAEPAAVLGYEFWERHFGADPAVTGRTLEIGRGSFTVVGVAPRGFTGAEIAPVDVWLPLRTDQAITTGDDVWADSRTWWWLQIVVRLAPGAGVEAAEAEATAVHRAARAADDDYDSEARILSASLIAADEPEVEARGAGTVQASDSGGGVDAVAVSRWLAGVSLIVLLIACANVANLLLARAVRLRRELAVRVALGISRGRLLLQLLAESLVLAGLGATAAVLLVHLGGEVITSTLLPEVAFGDTFTPRLLVFTSVAALLTAFMAGVVPAWQASQPDVGETLKGSTRSGSLPRSRLRTALLTAQAALSVLLLVGAGLFVRSLSAVESVDMGFEPQGLIVARLETSSPPLEDPSRLEDHEIQRLYARAEDRVSTLPMVRSAASTMAMPFASSLATTLHVAGIDSIPRLPSGGPYIYDVGHRYFETMGLQMVRGRAFEAADNREGAPPVAVVNETFARTVWSREDALGQCLFIRVEPYEGPCHEVIGVVSDSRRQEVTSEEPQMMYYVPIAGSAVPADWLLVRVAGPVEEALGPVRDALTALDSRIRYVQVQPFASFYQEDLRAWRLGAVMFSAFGLLALVVAAVGLYSVLAFNVAQRRYELGIRSALGASGERIVRLVFRQALEPVTGGIVLGLIAAGVAARWVEPLLYGVSPMDPLVYAGVAMALLAVAAVAAFVPAKRATAVDPSEALRAE